jgi:hypothetical protein
MAFLPRSSFKARSLFQSPVIVEAPSIVQPVKGEKPTATTSRSGGGGELAKALAGWPTFICNSLATK